MESLDRLLFLALNHLPHSIFLDKSGLFLSQSVIAAWAVFFLYLFSLIVVHKKNAGRGFVFLLLAVASGFILTSFGFKEFFKRPRPFLTLDQALVVQKGLKDYSFPSGHAFSASLLATLFIRKKRIFSLLAIYSLLVGFDRIYLGVHYPSDVLGGYLFGFVYGLSINHFYGRFLSEGEFHILKHHLGSRNDDG